MALGSVASMAKWTGFGADLARFFGTPIIALAIGTFIANTDIVNFISENAAVMASIGMFFSFLLSAILKTARGPRPSRS